MWGLLVFISLFIYPVTNQAKLIIEDRSGSGTLYESVKSKSEAFAAVQPETNIEWKTAPL